MDACRCSKRRRTKGGSQHQGRPQDAAEPRSPDQQRSEDQGALVGARETELHRLLREAESLKQQYDDLEEKFKNLPHPDSPWTRRWSEKHNRYFYYNSIIDKVCWELGGPQTPAIDVNE